MSAVPEAQPLIAVEGQTTPPPPPTPLPTALPDLLLCPIWVAVLILLQLWTENANI